MPGPVLAFTASVPGGAGSSYERRLGEAGGGIHVTLSALEPLIDEKLQTCRRKSEHPRRPIRLAPRGLYAAPRKLVGTTVGLQLARTDTI